MAERDEVVDDLDWGADVAQVVVTRVSRPAANARALPEGPRSQSRDVARRTGFLPARSYVLLTLALVLIVVGVDVVQAAGLAFFTFFLAAVRRFAARSDLSFARGFLRYQPDRSWPVGVQEDDDFRWQWARGAGEPQR